MPNRKPSNKIVSVVFSVLIILFIVVGTLMSTRVMKSDFSVDKVKLIFDMPSIRDSVSQHQKDARYLPYRIRLLVFNDSVYIYQIFRNIASFWNLNNINRIILLANIYPIYLALKLISKSKIKWWTCILGILAASIVIGINKMVDARSATWFIMPIFGYLTIIGIRKVNFKIYLPMLLISLFLLL